MTRISRTVSFVRCCPTPYYFRCFTHLFCTFKIGKLEMSGNRYMRSLVTDDLQVVLAGNDLTGGVKPGGSTTEGGGGQKPGGEMEI